MNKLLTVLLVVQAYSLYAVDYYVSSSGNDTNPGTTVELAWGSIERVNNHAANPGFLPGDRILFEGGKAFFGSLFLDGAGGRNAGTAATPIKISNYGNDYATIYSGDNYGIFVRDAAGYEISNLIFTGSGGQFSEVPGTSNNGGIAFNNYLDGNVVLDYISIDNVRVSRYYWNGIMIFGLNGLSGYSNINISNSYIFDCNQGGILVQNTVGFDAYSIYNLNITNCKIFGNQGRPDLPAVFGDGILVGNVVGGRIEGCEVNHNGSRVNSASSGISGISLYTSTDIIVQNNEIHHNQSLINGGGISLYYGGVKNILIQYNYIHDNYGAALALLRSSSALNDNNNIVFRYNISQNDGLITDKSAIYISSLAPFDNVEVYNNTIYSENRGSGPLSSIYLYNAYFSNVNFRNNIFYLSGPNTYAVYSYSPALTTINTTFRNNNYYSLSGGPLIRWGDNIYNSIDQWREAVPGQEVAGNITLGSPIVKDPLLQNPGRAGTIGNTQSLKQALLPFYSLRNESPLINAGIDLRISQNGSQDVGNNDFFGNIIPINSTFDVGAIESSFIQELSVSPDQVNVTNLFQSISITANIPWIASTTDNWIRILNSSGSGNGNLSIEFSPNTTGRARSGLILVNGGAITKAIFITQSISSVPTTDIGIDLSKPYYIIARHSNKSLESLNGSLDPGIGIVQTDKGQRITQLYKLEPAVDGYFRIINLQTQFCFDLGGGVIENSAPVLQNVCNNSQSQQWALEKIDDFYFKIRSKVSGKYFDIAYGSGENNARLIQYEGLNGFNQQFSFISVDLTVTPQPESKYFIEAVHSQKVLDFDGGELNSTADLIQNQWNNSLSQQFSFIPFPSGFYQLKVAHSNLCLEIKEINRDARSSLQQAPCNQNDYQLWKIQPVANDGRVNIVSKLNGRMIDIAGRSLENFAKAITWIKNDGYNQQFRLYSVQRTLKKGNDIGDEGFFARLYPNPSNGNFKINFNNEEEGQVNINIFDAVGKLVFQKNEIISPVNNTLDISLQNAATGYYSVEVTTKEWVKQYKVLVK